MRRYLDGSWIFPCCVFIFFSIFLFVKFIFIFFFQAAYEPSFIFDFTPVYLFSGIGNLQLLLLSFVVILLDTSLHLRPTKRRLLFSYLPTSVMLSGVGLIIMSHEVDISLVYHYVIFGCLLAVVLIDHQYVLSPKESFVTTNGKKAMLSLDDRKPVELLSPSMRAETPLYTTRPQMVATADIVLKQKESYDNLLQNIQALFDLLERKTMKLEKLENDIEKRNQYLIQQEEMLINRLASYAKSKEKTNVVDRELVKENPSVDQIFMKDKITNKLVIGDTPDCVALVQRGILKQVSPSFANFLGYEINELVNKNLFLFFTSEGMNNVKKYCESRLKGVALNSYKTVFLTKKSDQIPVEVIVRPTLYNGEAAELLYVKVSP
jgi:PAS domain S-box-containing protein